MKAVAQSVSSGKNERNRFHELKGAAGSPTVLDGKDKVGFFEEVVGEDDELSHEGGESEFFGFATGDEAEVERSEDRVVTGGDERGHVKDRAELGAATEDVALTAELTTVVVKGSDPGEGGGLAIGEGTKFGMSATREVAVRAPMP